MVTQIWRKTPEAVAPGPLRHPASQHFIVCCQAEPATLGEETAIAFLKSLQEKSSFRAELEEAGSAFCTGDKS